MPTFECSSYTGGFCIQERHNSKNTIHVFDGELSETAMRAIAYKILAMVESDRVI